MLWHRRSDDLGAAAHGSGVCCVSPPRHLRAGVAEYSGGAAARRRSYVDSRFSLKQRPRPLCDGMTSAQGFLSTWSLKPTAIPEEVDRDLLPPQHRRSTSALLGAAAGRTPPPRAGALGASTKDKPANDRTSPRVAPVHLLRKGSGFHRQRRRQGEGASSIQGQRICLMPSRHVTALRQGGVPRAPEVMLDDAVQARPRRLHLRRTRCIACSRRLLLRKE